MDSCLPAVTIAWEYIGELVFNILVLTGLVKGADRMDHADIQMTANIYGHLDIQRKQLLTEKMASSLF